jgi:hypothetical protein
MLVGKYEGKTPLGGLGTDVRIILQWILNKQDEEWIQLALNMIQLYKRSCEHG